MNRHAIVELRQYTVKPGARDTLMGSSISMTRRGDVSRLRLLA